MTDKLNRIHRQDCIRGMRALPAGSIDLAFADPPFNIGYEYDEYDDRRRDEEYLDWSRRWIGEVVRLLKADGTFWLAIGDEYAAELKVMMTRELGLACRSWVVWYYTFGVNCTQKFSRSHAHLFYMVKDERRFTFNADDPAIRVPSARQLVYGDKRANPKGRLPDDTWILRPQDVPESFQPHEDTWYYPRVNGTFKERKGWHGCQMPEQLLGRIIRACSNEGETVLDPFTGSGTTLAVAKKLNRQFIGFELSKEYAAGAERRLEATKPGQPLDGAENPLTSVPSTAAGTRLEERESRIRHAAKKVPEVSSSASCGGKSQIENQRIVISAYRSTHHGFSTDYLLANPELNAAFIDACRRCGSDAGAADLNKMLLRLRKSGKLERSSTKRVHVSALEMEKYIFASEIAARKLLDIGHTLDDVLSDPSLADQFDALAAKFAPGFAPFDYRWAALRVRKSYNQAVKRIAILDRSLKRRLGKRSFEIAERDCRRVPSVSGVYRVQNAVGQELYIGETKDLRERLSLQFSEDVMPAWRQLQHSLGVRLIPGVTGAQRAALQQHLISCFHSKMNYCTLSS